MERLARLSENVQMTFQDLADLDDNFLKLQEEHRQAKEKWIFAVDDAYERQEVEGKNERERDAHLRQIFRAEHNEIVRLEAATRTAERLAKRKRTDAERLTLQVQIARLTLDTMRNFEQARAVVE